MTDRVYTDKEVEIFSEGFAAGVALSNGLLAHWERLKAPFYAALSRQIAERKAASPK